ncbi:MAG: hypothetical protein ACRDQ7_23480 [Haloechinothrix sp.]
MHGYGSIDLEGVHTTAVALSCDRDLLTIAILLEAAAATAPPWVGSAPATGMTTSWVREATAMVAVTVTVWAVGFQATAAAA